MSPDYPLTIFYDASCAVCGLEMDLLRSRDASDKLVLVDVSEADFDAARWGLEAGALDAAIHGLRPDGSVVRGMDVLRLGYAAAGLGWVLRPTALAPLRPLFDLCYRIFARYRRPLSRRLAPLIDALRRRRARRVDAGMAKCVAGACAATHVARNGRFDKARP